MIKENEDVHKFLFDESSFFEHFPTFYKIILNHIYKLLHTFIHIITKIKETLTIRT